MMTPEKTCSRCKKGVGRQLLKEFDWKVKIRFFRTLLTTFVYGHIFWECPKRQTFWKNVKEELERILAMDLPMDSVISIRCDSNHLFTTERTVLYITCFVDDCKKNGYY